jgi:hypothetical protein
MCSNAEVEAADDRDGNGPNSGQVEQLFIHQQKGNV